MRHSAEDYKGYKEKADGSPPQTSQFVFSDLLVLQAAPYDPTAPQPSTKHSRSFAVVTDEF